MGSTSPGEQCRGRESNPHALRHRILNPAWLPVTPPRLEVLLLSAPPLSMQPAPAPFFLFFCGPNPLSSSSNLPRSISMHFDSPAHTPPILDDRPWYKTLTRYHWFVLAVAALGWLFDTMDQQLFNLARAPAMKALVVTSQDDASAAGARITEFAGYATSIFLIGWATGGLFFGVLGDRIGRVKTMMLTILLYSLFTGLSAFSQNFWQFAVFRFLTGLGVGGEFAVGVSLVAEVMPDKARPFALGLLQALSAVGNISAALINNGLVALSERGGRGSMQLA